MDMNRIKEFPAMPSEYASDPEKAEMWISGRDAAADHIAFAVAYGSCIDRQRDVPTYALNHAGAWRDGWLIRLDEFEETGE